MSAAQLYAEANYQTVQAIKARRSGRLTAARLLQGKAVHLRSKASILLRGDRA